MKAPTHLKTAHQADSVTSQNTWNFSNTAVRTSHLTRCLTVLLGCVELFERFRIYFDFLILLRAEEITKFQLGSNVKLIPVAIWHVASVPGCMISVVVLLYNTPHWSSNSWSHATLLWWSCISNAVFAMHSRRYLSEPFSLDRQFWHLTWLHLCCKICRTLSRSLQPHKPIPPLLVHNQVLFIPCVLVPIHEQCKIKQ